MIYTEHDKLTIIELEKEADSITYEQIGAALKERPANVIYCELGEKLYGVVSMGDVERAKSAGKKEVNINRGFTSVDANEYMKVRQIFKERERINEVPVVDEKRRLLGDYAREDDLVALPYSGLVVNNQYTVDFWEENDYVALVKPCDAFLRKKILFEKWYYELEYMGVRVEIIDRLSVPLFMDEVKLVLFTDEAEKRGVGTLIGRILNEEFVWSKFVTFKQIVHRIESKIKTEIQDEVIACTVKAFKAAGGQNGHILALQVRDNGSEYYRRLIKEEIHQKFVYAGVPVSGRLPSSAMKDFFGELYTEEYAAAMMYPPFRIGKVGLFNILMDISEKYHNVRNGERLTSGQPDEYDRTVWLFGPCLIQGSFVEDKHTIASFLQMKYNSLGIRCKIANLGCVDTTLGILDRIVKTPIMQNDVIVMCLDNNRDVDSIDNLNLIDALEDHNAISNWFIDNFLHCNYRANRVFADAIYEKLQSMLKESGDLTNELINIDRDIVVSTYAICYCKNYFINFKPEQYDTIGSIVMNCNPFTNGHRYLIEEALKNVDFLIIFVVEEDGSVFTFDERFALVNGGVADLQNVMVVPSGELILSKRTFPEYFLKVEDDNLIKNVEHDITLFADQIAPKLKITYRFVGEEPQDRVTNEYNQAMKRILPAKGINLIEIPRKENEKGVISASVVRKCLEENNLTELEKLVPKSTMEILGLSDINI